MARRSSSRKSMKKRRISRKRRAQRGGRRSDYASKMSLAQGAEYSAIHRLQHGGAAPVGDYGMLDSSLREAARVGVLDRAISQAEAYGNPPLASQTGGRRKTRKGSRKATRKDSRKNRKGSRKNRKSSRRNGLRKQSGGAVLSGAPYGGSTMLLSPLQAMKAGTADFSDPFARGH